MDRNHSLSALLAPVSLEEFFSEYYEKKFLYIERNDETYFDDILNADDIDVFLQNRIIPTQSIRIVEAGKDLPLREFARGSNFGAETALADNTKLFSLYSSGKTLRQIRKVNRTTSSSNSGALCPRTSESTTLPFKSKL